MNIPSSGAAPRPVNRAARKESLQKDKPQEATKPQEVPSFEERVEEVLQNGGFLSRDRTVRAAKAGVDVYEYQRLSRDGGPLAGEEARRPPTYTLTAWGTLALSCTCPQAKRTRVICKHQAALTRSLLGRITSDSIGDSHGR